MFLMVSGESNFFYRKLPVEQIDLVQPLCERQREFHVSATQYFAEDVRRRRFEERKAERQLGDANRLLAGPPLADGRPLHHIAGRALDRVTNVDVQPTRPGLGLPVGGGRIVGYCVSSVSGGADSAGCQSAGSHAAEQVGEIDSLFVLDEFRGRGIGTELVRRALVWLRGREPGKIIVVALAENVAATEFYKRFGLMLRAVVSELVLGKKVEA
jgi:ribosomal protein S18 acetylase RimI-like enzyme